MKWAPADDGKTRASNLFTGSQAAHLARRSHWFTGVEYRYSQYEAKSFVSPIPILNLGLVGSSKS